MKRLIPLVFTAILFFLDQIIKNWALNTLEPLGKIPVINDFFSLTYIENRGAAFGIFQDKTAVLSVVSGALLFVIIVALLLGKIKSGFLMWWISIGLAGGLGNLYDRIARGFVVDYLDFSPLFGFPVFNFADCLVVIATAMILYYCLKLESSSAKREDAADG